MFYYLYEVKNNLNGKIYVGVHKTKSLDDGYIGSGKIIGRAIKKHGIENFTKVILEQFDNSADMYAREKEVVTDEFLLREDVYNLKRGGEGSFDYVNKTAANLYGKNGTAGYGLENLSNGWNRIRTQNEFDKISETLKKKYATGELVSSFVELNSNVEFIENKKRIFKEIGHQQGDKNSQAGTMWITNEVKNKKIKKQDPIPEGWRMGRNVVF